MSDYTQVTFFAPKDALITGNPAKKIKGSEFDPEFAAISTAIATKYDSADVASNAEAAALSSDTKLITPAKLAHALQNASITLGANILLNGGIAPSDVARLSVANTFTANQAISGTTPVLRITETDGTLNNKHWVAFAAANQLSFGVATDASPDVSAANFLYAVRSGTTISTVNIAGTTVTINGNTVWHAGNDGFGSGLDASTVEGLFQSPLATATTIMARDGSADTEVRYLKSTAANNENPTISQIMVTNGTDNTVRKASVAALSAALNTTVGQYTPGVGCDANCTSPTATLHSYSRVGSIVTLSGKIALTVTSGGSVLTDLRVVLPIASNFGSSVEANGTGSTNVSNGSPVFVEGDATNDQLRLQFYSSAAGAQSIYYMAQYHII